jgi:uncharacterized protein
MAKVLITGGTGLIGGQLTQCMQLNGHEVVHLSRNPTGKEDVPTFQWDPMNSSMDVSALDGVETIIHLAGAAIMGEKWSQERKQVILDSRIKSADLLHHECIRNNVRLKHFISASAIGWYPLILSDNVYDESSPPGNGFLADVCKKWEASADQFKDVASYVAKVRIGLVLTKSDGALSQISRPIRFYIGAGLGTGTQFMSWIHLTDVSRIFCHIMEKNLNGIYNAVGPEATSNQEFMQTVADIIDRPILLPNIPEFIIKIMFGQASEIVLRGVPLSSTKIEATGFHFNYPTLTSSLFNIYWTTDLSSSTD